MSQADTHIPLPDNMVTSTDLAKVIKEVDLADEFLSKSGHRKPGKPVTLPKISKPLNDVAELNNISLLDKTDRSKLKKELQNLLDNPLKVHISFASSPSGTFKQQIISWFRREVHPAVFVEVGLQPSIAAGCIVKTASKTYDISLKNRFDTNREILAKALDSRPQ